MYFILSPSTRRAWIEIRHPRAYLQQPAVALHPEGVDRNYAIISRCGAARKSPSTRRAWIEIQKIEDRALSTLSPSTRRAWIEIIQLQILKGASLVALHPEGVDRNSLSLELLP